MFNILKSIKKSLSKPTFEEEEKDLIKTINWLKEMSKKGDKKSIKKYDKIRVRFIESLKLLRITHSEKLEKEKKKEEEISKIIEEYKQGDLIK